MLKQAGGTVVIVFAVLAVAPASSPVQLSYVYSDSMEPTIGADDGYVLVPAGDVSTGEVVTFRSPDRDGYVTHRIVGTSADGYVTKGDNNPTTDQAAGYSHVRRSEIVGEVLAVGGHPVVIPGLGVVVTAVRSHRLALAAVVAAALAYRRATGTGSSHPRPSLVRARSVVWPVLIAGYVLSVGLILWGSHATPVDPTAGDAGNLTMLVNRSETPLTRRSVAATGVDVVNRSRNATAITVGVRPPSGAGSEAGSLAVYQYPAVLPAALLDWLHRFHPAAAAVASTGAVMAPVFLTIAATVDGRAPIRPPRSRWLRRLWRGRQ